MENNDQTRTYVLDLLSASGLSGSGLAAKAGVSKVNTLRWVKGLGQSLGPVGVGKLLTALGVRDGHLDPSRVHYFKIKSESALSAFLRILEGEGFAFEMALVAPEKSAVKDFLTVGAVTPSMLWSPLLRIVVENVLFSKDLSDDLLKTGRVKWRTDLGKDEYFSHPTVRVPRGAFDSLKKQSLSSTEDIDRILHPPSLFQENQAPAWEAVVEAFKAAGFSPKEALALIPPKKRKEPEK